MTTNYSAPYSPIVELRPEDKWTTIKWNEGTNFPGGSLFELERGRAVLEAEFSVSGIENDPAARDWTVYIQRVRIRNGVKDPTHKLDYSPPRRGSYKGIDWVDVPTWIEEGETWFFEARLLAENGFVLPLRPIAAKGLVYASYVAENIKSVPR